MFRIFVYISVLLVLSVNSARILGVFPTPSISHQVVFRPLMLELARRGHEVVVITPNPALPKIRPPDNVTEIDVSFGYERLGQLVAAAQSIVQRGVIVPANVHLKVNPNNSLIPVFVDMIESPEVKKYTEDKNQHFDLVIAEAYMNYQLILSHIFKAPTILFSSVYGLPESFESLGSPARHPSLYPSPMAEILDAANIKERFEQVKLEFNLLRATREAEAFENEYLKKNYGPNAPTVEELRSKVDMFFINSHPAFSGNRPLTPNVQYVGPMHLQPLKPLPEEMQKYLDKSKNGVIYVSLGTNVRPSLMDKEMLDSFLDAFRELPYDVMWKFDGENLKNLSKNVRSQKWFPQRDLLVHPKIKLFVTQGGLQSTDEAIDAGVPLVGIPMMGDQFFNVNRYVKLGIGVKVDALTLTKESLLEGIQKILDDDSYRKSIRKLRNIIHDQPQTPLERAVWWTEYVLRHGGAKHLRCPAADISWAQYLMLDVVAAIVTVCLAALGLLYYSFRWVSQTVQSKKLKQS